MAVAPAGRQLADSADREFWAKLPSAKSDGQGCLQLAEGTSFLGQKRFMIRACYEQLAARLDTYFGKPGNSGMVVLGNPGRWQANTILLT